MATKRSFDEDTDGLQAISVLFIPFDASGPKFFASNAKKGVFGLQSTVDESATRMEVELQEPLVTSGNALPKESFAKELSKIAKQECELIRNIHNPDTDYDEIFELLVKSQHPDTDPTTWSPQWKSRVTRNLRGYKHYPTLIFLSENPTKPREDFPDVLDTSNIDMPDLKYVKKHEIGSDIAANVNEMAVYVRADIGKRIDDSMGEQDESFLTAETITRKTTGQGLPEEGKDEYMIRVTIGKRSGHSFTVAGVHLRAGLTKVTNKTELLKERKGLQKFCEDSGIQLMVGDFNMDLQTFDEGQRGVYFDAQEKHLPRFMIKYHKGESGEDVDPTVYPGYVQQYSNSSGDRHYMGFFQADRDELRLVGLSMFGPMGASLSRSFKGGGPYYSDHPSIFFRVESERLTEEAKNAILRRKIVKIKRQLKL